MTTFAGRPPREPLGRGLRPQVASPGDLARLIGLLGREEELQALLRLRRLIALDRRLSSRLDSRSSLSAEQ